MYAGGELALIGEGISVFGFYNATTMYAFHPVSGPGFHYLDRGGYQALSIYNKFGLTSQAEGILDKMETTEAARSAAQAVWRLLQ